MGDKIIFISADERLGAAAMEVKLRWMLVFIHDGVGELGVEISSRDR